MSIVVGLVVGLLVVVWAVRRRRRVLMLAGRIAERPTYAIDPPRRHLGNRKGERL